MNLLITLTSAGLNSGPFNLYSDTDYFTAFASDVPKQDLLDGYTANGVPDGTTIVRVQSDNPLCTNYEDLPVPPTTTTTSSTSTSTSTSTTTTTTTNVCADCVIGTELQIGNQTWLACNLNVDTYRNGDPIYHATDPTDWLNKGAAGIGAWCYWNNDPANGPIYGKLYNWHVANDTAHGGVGPAGWHVPTETEWNTLYSTIDAISPTGNVGGKMKSACPNHWVASQFPTNVDATNQSGFRGLGAGFRNVDYAPPSGFGGFGWDETWWEFGSLFSPTRGYGRYLRKNTGIAYRDDYPFTDGYGIRLIKD